MQTMPPRGPGRPEGARVPPEKPARVRATADRRLRVGGAERPRGQLPCTEGGNPAVRCLALAVPRGCAWNVDLGARRAQSWGVGYPTGRVRGRGRAGPGSGHPPRATQPGQLLGRGAQMTANACRICRVSARSRCNHPAPLCSVRCRHLFSLLPPLPTPGRTGKKVWALAPLAPVGSSARSPPGGRAHTCARTPTAPSPPPDPTPSPPGPGTQGSHCPDDATPPGAGDVGVADGAVRDGRRLAGRCVPAWTHFSLR